MSMSTRRVSSDDVVLIEEAKSTEESTVLTINCPDKAGLGCDLCSIVLEFGLRINRADFSTDGRWCYMVFWVVPYPTSHRVHWDGLKSRLSRASPPCLGPFFFDQKSSGPWKPPLYLLKFCCIDRKGLLHDVTKVITELEFIIQRVKVMTTPDGSVVDLFFITDGRELLHTRRRQDETCACLATVFTKYCISCGLQLAGPEYESLQAFSFLPPAVAAELFTYEQSEKESGEDKLQKDSTTLNKATIAVDDLLSPSHTLLQIQCIDQKGLFYDILRTSKDCNVQVSYGRFSPSGNGYHNVDLFIRQKDGKKIVDPRLRFILCSRLQEEMLCPVRVIVADRGPDTELLVANSVELCGKGRPRVFYDVTWALKKFGICVILAEIGRHTTQNRQWEVYRFLLDDNCEFSSASDEIRNQIVDRVKKTLMGW